MDPELRDALDQLAAGLRGEIRSGDAETREALSQLAVDLRGEIRSSATETRAYVDERIQAFSAEMRRHFDVVGESLRSDIRAVAEGWPHLASRRSGGLVNRQGGPTASRAGS